VDSAEQLVWVEVAQQGEAPPMRFDAGGAEDKRAVDVDKQASNEERMESSDHGFTH
jgi:hypothetical protein